MSQEINYFDEANVVKGGFIEFKKFGDNVAGTLIDRQEKPNNLDPDKTQMVYTIRKDDGGIALVGGKAYIDNQMKFIKLGQKIALKYVSDKPAKKKGMNPMKIINLYTPKNPDGSLMFDTDFIMGSEVPVESGTPTGGTFHETAKEDDGEIKIEDIPMKPFGDDEPKKEVDPVLKKLEQILVLAKAKLGATTDAEVSMVTMQSTGLAFLPINYDKILEQLLAK